jgi:chromosome segregation ATPase
VTQLDEQLKQYEGLNASMKKELAECTTQYSILLSKLSLSESTRDELISTIERQTQTIDSIERSNRSLERTYADECKNRSDGAQYKMKLDSVERSFRQYREETSKRKCESQEKLSQLQNEIRSLNTSILQQKQDCDRLKSIELQSNRQNDQFKIQLNEVKEKNRLLEVECEQMQRKLEDPYWKVTVENLTKSLSDEHERVIELKRVNEKMAQMIHRQVQMGN